LLNIAFIDGLKRPESEEIRWPPGVIVNRRCFWLSF
jgi:hypothetical protein